MIDDKVSDILKNENVFLEQVTNKRVHFSVKTDNEHFVMFDKEKIGWNCDCAHFTIKKLMCKHISACKKYYESKIINKASIELERVRFALKELKLIKVDEKSKGLFELIKSYAKDSEHFFNKNDFLESFEISCYVFGLLDSAAKLGVINPGKAKKHYKI